MEPMLVLDGARHKAGLDDLAVELASRSAGFRHSVPDRRGHLSEEALAAFTRFFLERCLDQVTFMEGLVEPGLFPDRTINI